MGTMFKVKKWFLLTLVTIALLPGQAMADVELKELGSMFDKVSVGFESHFFYMANSNTYFGSDALGDKDYNWAENATKLRLTVAKDLGWSNVEAQAGLVGMATIGEDHYAARKDVSKVDLSQAWIKFGNIGKSPFSLTVGRQDVLIEKGFVVKSGNWSPAAATWIAPINSFPFALRLDGDFGDLSTTAFWARSENHIDVFTPDQYEKQGVEVAGLNLHYDISEQASVYGGYYYKYDTNDVAGDAQTSINSFDAGFDVSLNALQLEGEFVYQTGDIDQAMGPEVDHKAMAGFAAATYRFDSSSQPFVKLSAMHFSGDDDPNDDENNLYDPIFSTGFTDWNRWIIGEIVGDHHLNPNGNKTSYVAEVGFSPNEWMIVTFACLRHYLNEKNFHGVDLNDKHFADEFFINNDYFISDNLYLQTSIGAALPGDAAEEYWGDDKTSYQAWAYMIFGF